jgi:DNA-binding beta-propeller fold protein YncE/mono/diheme cytochrome c family protein
MSVLLLTAVGLAMGTRSTAAEASSSWLSPSALLASADGAKLYVACATANRVNVLDAQSGAALASIEVPSTPTGLALTRDGARLYVTCAGVNSRICEIDLAKGTVTRTLTAGHTAMSPVLSIDDRTLYVCQRFSSCVSIYDLEPGRERTSVPVGREPISAALTPDNRFLLVAHHLPMGRADGEVVAASVSVIDVAAGKVTKELQLPNGSSVLRDIRISPDGAYACVAHNLGRYQMPTTQLERGWMNTSALTLINLKEQRVLNTVLLDDVDRGAANPWGLAWSKDGGWLCVTHAGTHELSVIRFPDLVSKLMQVPVSREVSTNANAYTQSITPTAAEVPNDLAFLVGVRERVKLEGNGPRSVAVVGNQAYVANYYSDTIEVIDLAKKRPARPALTWHGKLEMSELRRGEMFFNDAGICFQGWQSCGTCHSEDGRVDGLNWDLLNDGLGNPKNSKSLLWTHRTPPAMSMGVRETGETAVRAGIRHILFTVQPESVPTAMDAWLKSLQPIPSPFLVDGQLSPAARRGQRLFQSARVGCAGCHPADLWTNLEHYDVGSANALDRGNPQFDTPSLVELWRTAPYLHDGSAATVRDVLTVRNAGDRHGHTSDLTHDQIEDLVAYLLSL